MDTSSPSPTTPANPYQTPNDGSQQGGVVVGQNIVNAINALNALVGTINSSFVNVFRPSTTASSPAATGINNLGTTAVRVIGTATGRHGITFQNPSTGSVYVWVFPSSIASSPSLSSLGGSWLIVPGGDLKLPTIEFSNVNTAFSAFASSGTSNALTIWEFL